jgi:hypothetical protein
MKTYAFIRNNAVHLIDQIEESEYQNHIRHWDAIIDIEGISPQPQVGWILVKNILMPVPPLEQQKQQRIFGKELSDKIVDKFGERNFILAQTGTEVNIIQLLNGMGAVKMLLDTGALKTARGIMYNCANNYPAYADIINFGINEITQFLQSKGWE